MLKSAALLFALMLTGGTVYLKTGSESSQNAEIVEENFSGIPVVNPDQTSFHHLTEQLNGKQLKKRQLGETSSPEVEEIPTVAPGTETTPNVDSTTTQVYDPMERKSGENYHVDFSLDWLLSTKIDEFDFTLDHTRRRASSAESCQRACFGDSSCLTWNWCDPWYTFSVDDSDNEAALQESDAGKFELQTSRSRRSGSSGSSRSGSSGSSTRSGSSWGGSSSRPSPTPPPPTPPPCPLLNCDLISDVERGHSSRRNTAGVAHWDRLARSLGENKVAKILREKVGTYRCREFSGLGVVYLRSHVFPITDTNSRNGEKTPVVRCFYYKRSAGEVATRIGIIVGVVGGVVLVGGGCVYCWVSGIFEDFSFPEMPEINCPTLECPTLTCPKCPDCLKILGHKAVGTSISVKVELSDAPKVIPEISVTVKMAPRGSDSDEEDEIYGGTQKITDDDGDVSNGEKKFQIRQFLPFSIEVEAEGYESKTIAHTGIWPWSDKKFQVTLEVDTTNRQDEKEIVQDEKEVVQDEKDDEKDVLDEKEVDVDRVVIHTHDGGADGA